MAKGVVLVIEHDEWVSALLSKYLSEAGFSVEVETQARQGFARATELVPDCIICDVELPDIDGFWVARRVRTAASPVARIPFLFLTNADDSDSRLQGLNVGADLYITKPFNNEEVVAQVTALIDMAKRLREKQDSGMDGPASSRSQAAFHGDMAHLSLATVLTLLDMERRNGVLKIKPEGGKQAVLQLSEGALVSASIGGVDLEPIEAIREVIHWKEGSFSFRPGAPSSPRASRDSLGAILLEAMRLEDEEAAR